MYNALGFDANYSPIAALVFLFWYTFSSFCRGIYSFFLSSFSFLSSRAVEFSHLFLILIMSLPVPPQLPPEREDETLEDLGDVAVSQLLLASLCSMPAILSLVSELFV